jgi:hypothetical protein
MRANHAAALEAFEVSGRDEARRPELISALGYTHARAGHVDAARAALQELAALDRTRYVSPVAIAQVQAGLGDLDAATDALGRAADLTRDGSRLARRPAGLPAAPPDTPVSSDRRAHGSDGPRLARIIS